jgi:phosphoribosylformylglycinamidine synthase
MVGLIEHIDHVTRATFAEEGDAIIVLGDCTDELGGSEYLSRLHDTVAGAPPRCDLDGERRLIAVLLEAIRAGHVSSAHDCSEGGLAVALAECAMMNREQLLGLDVDLSAWDALPRRAVWFGEAQGRAIVSSANADAVLAIAAKHNVPARRVGSVRSVSSGIVIKSHGTTVRTSTEQVAAAYHDAIPAIMEGSPETTAAEQREGVVL